MRKLEPFPAYKPVVHYGTTQYWQRWSVTPKEPHYLPVKTVQLTLAAHYLVSTRIIFNSPRRPHSSQPLRGCTLKRHLPSNTMSRLPLSPLTPSHTHTVAESLCAAGSARRQPRRRHPCPITVRRRAVAARRNHARFVPAGRRRPVLLCSPLPKLLSSPRSSFLHQSRSLSSLSAAQLAPLRAAHLSSRLPFLCTRRPEMTLYWNTSVMKVRELAEREAALCVLAGRREPHSSRRYAARYWRFENA